MCMIEHGDEAASVYEAKDTKARRNHMCSECRRTIQPGEIYERVGMLFDGRWSRFKTCAHCMAARSWLEKVCGGFLHGCVKEDLLDHWNQVGYQSKWLERAVEGLKIQWEGMPSMLKYTGTNYEKPAVRDGHYWEGQ